MRALICLSAFALLAACAEEPPASEPGEPSAAYEIVPVAGGLDHPWSVAFLPDGGFLVTERSGALRRVSADGEVSDALSGVPAVFAAGQGGLFEIALAPDFEDSGTVFLSYAYGTNAENGTALMRATLADDGLTGGEEIFRSSAKRGAHHFGGRMAFLDDGTILLTLGDGFEFRERAQSLEDHLGTIVRIAPDGAALADNPFADQEGARPEIWSYGHRNVQAILRDPATGTVWSNEHGPRGGDELNIIEPGANHGWPVVTDGVDYSGARISPYGLDRAEEMGFAVPVHVWTPSIAPSAMTLYDGDAFPSWRGDLFVSALAGQAVHRLEIEAGGIADEEMLFTELGARIRDVRTGPDGLIYLLTDSPDGQLLAVRPAAAPGD
ncbi:PQQ-dependent sugar dehydrogenase [Glycocaulis profundi]|nr:PQQ-dependent sugar dehydrogenase [Glycocaulis profundi]